MASLVLFLGIALLLVGSGVLYVALLKPFVFQRGIRQGLRLRVYRIVLPQYQSKNEGTQQDPTQLIAVMEQLYASFTSVRRPGTSFRPDPHISLEIVNPADTDEIQFFLGVPRDYVSILEKQIHGQYPGAEIEDVTDYETFDSEAHISASKGDTARSDELPLRTYTSFESDPLNQITSALSKIQRDESAGIQLLIKPISGTWGTRAKRIVQEMQDGYSYDQARKRTGWMQFVTHIKQSSQKEQAPPSLSPKQQELMQAIDAKTSKPAFKVNLRVLAVAHEESRAAQLREEIEGAFAQFQSSEENRISFRRVPPRRLPLFVYRFLFRVFQPRQTMRLNTEELTTLYHLPTPFLETPKIRWMKFKRAHPPSNVPDQGLMIGKNTYRGEQTEVKLQQADRRRHTYVIGQTGTGKSALLKKMIEQDLANGEGVALLDPNGDLAEEVLSLVPKERAEELVYFNPQDSARPLGLNILEARTPEEKDFITQEMISIFYKLVSDPSMIGPIFEHNMRNAMLALMADSENPGTITEIPRLFTDEEFRKEVLKNVEDPMVRDFWENEFPKSQTGQQAGDIIGYLLSKLGRFIENEMIRNIIGQKESSFNFDSIMNERQILICNLSKGGLGEINSSLLGMLIVSKLQMAAFRRNAMPQEERKDFYLYLDEFQNFTTESISTILSEARKYRLNLTIAHQFIGQLDEPIRNAVFGNVGTSIILRVGTDDAAYLENKVQPQFQAYDLVRLDNLHAVVALMIEGETSKPFNLEIVFAGTGNTQLKEALVELSRLKYGTKKEVVARNIKRRAQIG